MKILVVDDSKTMRRILSQLLKKMGYEVLEAGDGVEAIQILQLNADIELLITDWNMPNMDGLELLQIVRKEEKFKDLKIVMVTANTGRAEVITALKAGANNYIAKPFIAHTIERMLEGLDV